MHTSKFFRTNTGRPGVCVAQIKLTFSPICIQHDQCPCWCFILQRDKLRSHNLRDTEMSTATTARRFGHETRSYADLLGGLLLIVVLPSMVTLQCVLLHTRLLELVVSGVRIPRRSDFIFIYLQYKSNRNQLLSALSSVGRQFDASRWGKERLTSSGDKKQGAYRRSGEREKAPAYL